MIAKDNITLLSEFLKVFYDAAVLMGVFHVIYFIVGEIFSRRNIAYFICAVIFLFYGTGSIYEASSFEIRWYYILCYILSYIVYRFSLYYLIDYALSVIFYILTMIFSSVASPVRKFIGKYGKILSEKAKKAQKRFYTLLQNGKKVYNKYKSFFTPENYNGRKKIKKTKEGGN